MTLPDHHRNNRTRLTSAIRSTRGAIDLASIMVGVLVIGIVGGVIAATVFAVIPWSQDEAAKGDISAVLTAESVYRTLNGTYADEEVLYAPTAFDGASSGAAVGGVAAMARGVLTAEKPLLQRGSRPLDIEATAKTFIVSVLSETGTTFYGRSGSAEITTTKPVFGGAPVLEPTPTPTPTATPKPTPVAESLMKFTIDTKLRNVTDVTLPVAGAAAATTVDWGDGKKQTISGDNMTHKYAAMGAYEITIDGQFNRFGINGWQTKNDSELITAVTRWDEGTKVVSVENGFAQSAVTSIVAPPSTVKIMKDMFESAMQFNGSTADWNTSKVTDMSGMFSGASKFNQSVSGLDTDNVTDMSRMFAGGDVAFNQPITFTTAKVTNMYGMFNLASAFNQQLPETFDTRNVVKMTQMFDGATAFNKPLPASFDTRNVTEMDQMFANAAAFNQPMPVNFDTGKVEQMTAMFYGASSFDSSLGSKFRTDALVDEWSLYAMFQDATRFDQDLSGWSVAHIANPPLDFATGSGLSTQHMPNWPAPAPAE